ncbi:MAG: response regulator [Candidatus Eisenbacteria bacterium]|uniref:histidine kinase n=1 Tax=Eiseniibacteriota bacterium TaxID=2212470 RepID=A0A937XBS2_UNCEI|nr:response regulator [Candidatus Eisenbacteria bacterium]
MDETLHLLVVDDELGMRLSVERALRGWVANLPDIDCAVTFRVSQAESGEEALALMARDMPQIMLLDYKLPGISGIDVLGKLDPRTDTHVVMITAYASLETAVQATKLGAFDFLAKPFTPDELKAVVRKTAKHQLAQRHARKLAEERRQIRFRFLSVLAHELKAPLAAVEGYLNIFRDHAMGEAIGEYDAAISRSLIRLEGMKKLISDLLDLTRIESGHKQRTLSEVDVCAIAQQAIETGTALAGERGIAFSCELRAPVMIVADAGEIEIVLNNLISNAVKYNKPGGMVKVAVDDLGDSVRISVQDTGIGMSPEEVSRLFGEFTRIRNEKTKNILGSGLGLSIVKRLAYLYGGEVAVDSAPDEGSTFTVRLLRNYLPPSSGDPDPGAPDAIQI